MTKRFDVAVMHDYYVDRLIHTRRLKTTIQQIRNKARSGGGGLHGYVQEEIRGGNSVNLANALAKLGLRVLLITHSEQIHEHLLRESFQGLRAEVRVKPLPAGLTVAIEEKVNVMLGDGRGATDFGPSELDEDDWRGLENSKIVCSVNWAANKKGTELIMALRKRLGEEKTIFVDPADFRDRIGQFKELMFFITSRRLINWISMNEFESLAAAKALRLRASDRAARCRGLARELRVVFDMHCVDGSFSSEGTRVTSVLNRVVRSKRMTGAGDVWDAAAIYGRLKGMDEVARLSFANMAARFYLESKDAIPPTLAQLQ